MSQIPGGECGGGGALGGCCLCGWAILRWGGRLQLRAEDPRGEGSDSVAVHQVVPGFFYPEERGEAVDIEDAERDKGYDGGDGLRATGQCVAQFERGQEVARGSQRKDTETGGEITAPVHLTAAVESD